MNICSCSKIRLPGHALVRNGDIIDSAVVRFVPLSCVGQYQSRLVTRIVANRKPRDFSGRFFGFPEKFPISERFPRTDNSVF